MKNLLLTIGIILCFNFAFAQSKEVSLLEKKEPDILFAMRNDTAYRYDSMNREDDGNYHLTYKANNSNVACNFYFKNNVCKSIGFYYPVSDRPSVISSLNDAYKRTDKNTWVDNSMTYEVKLVADDDFIQVGFKKL